MQDSFPLSRCARVWESGAMTRGHVVATVVVAVLGAASSAVAAAPRTGEQVEVVRPGAIGPVDATPLPDGGAALVVRDTVGGFLPSDPPARVRLLRLDRDARLVGPGRRLDRSPGVLGPDPAANGGLLAVSVADGSAMVVNVLDATGAPTGGTVTLDPGTPSVLVHDPRGGRVLLASTARASDSSDVATVQVRALGPGGAPLGPAVPVAPAGPVFGAPRLAIAPNGEALVVWSGAPVAGGDLRETVLARRLDASGAPVGEVLQFEAPRLPANLRRQVGTLDASVAAGDDGTFVVAWGRVVALQTGARDDGRISGIGMARLRPGAAAAEVFAPSAARRAALTADERVAVVQGIATVTYVDGFRRLVGVRIPTTAGGAPSAPFPVSAVPGALFAGGTALLPLGSGRLAALFLAGRPVTTGSALWLRTLPPRSTFVGEAPRVTVRAPSRVPVARAGAVRLTATCSRTCSVAAVRVTVPDSDVAPTVATRKEGRRITVRAGLSPTDRADLRRTLRGTDTERLDVVLVVRDRSGNLRRVQRTVRITV